MAASKFDSKFIGIGQSREEMLFGYAMLADTIDCKPLPAPIAPDPDDDWVIATAIAAQADLIVAGDKPFLGCRGGGIDPHYYGWGRSGAILIGQPFLHAIILICSYHAASIQPA